MEFMERCESTEDFEGDATKSKSKSNGSKRNKDKDGKGKKEKKYCSHHGENYTHDSTGCFVLHPELKSKSKNKTWSKKAADEKKKTKLDLAAFVKKEVKKAMEKASKAATKKHKESEDSNNSLCAFDAKELNYEDMDNLRIDSDDKVSV